MSWNKGWDNVFRNYEWGKYPDTALVRFIARNYKNKQMRKKINVLEIGCGTGANLWFLAKEGFNVYGIDGSFVALQKANTNFKEENFNFTLKRGDILRLPYKEKKFDAVIDVECLYANSMKHSKIILDEIKRVLKPGGLLFSMTFMTGTHGDGKGKSVKNEPNTYTNLQEGPFKSGYGIIRFTSEKDLIELYSRIGIKEVEYNIRSDKNRSYEIKEWIVICEKNG